MTMRRVALHGLIVLLSGAMGLYACSYKVFPLALGVATRPVAPLIGIAAGLFFAATAGLTGLGFWSIVDLVKNKQAIEQVPRDRLFDLLAETQYLTLGLLLVLAHFWTR